MSFSRKAKPVILIATIVAALCVASGCFFYFTVYVPNKKSVDIDWLNTATESELRELSHTLLATRFGNHHDACLYVGSVGNKDSVPLLIDVLGYYESDEEFVVCTYSHCVEALESLSGVESLRSREDWHNWWRKEGRDLSPDIFHPKSDGNTAKQTPHNVDASD